MLKDLGQKITSDEIFAEVDKLDSKSPKEMALAYLAVTLAVFIQSERAGINGLMTLDEATNVVKDLITRSLGGDERATKKINDNEPN